MKKMLRALAVLGGTTFLFLLAATSAGADGIIIPEPIEPIPPDMYIVPFLPIKYHRVTVEIDNQVAQVEVDQVFVNDSDHELEATYVFPLPEDAAISDFALYVDGERLEGRILDKDEAREIYEDIVRHRRDPALLEYVGRNTFRAQVFPIPPQGERRIQISYTEVLSQDNGLVSFVYPLNTEKFSPVPLEEVTITVDISSTTPIKAVYSPSHDVAIDREDEHHVGVSYEENDVTPSTDFELFYSVSQDDFGANLLTYRDGDDGFYLLLVAPKADFGGQEVVAKDVMIVVDVSGSMEGEKLEQAKDAMNYVLDHLNAEDRFNIVAFSTTVDLYAKTLQGADETADARSFIRRLEAAGGTNINEALLTALDRLPGERPELLIFLTDGLPTAGVTEPGPIITSTQDAAGPTVRLFAFGVGYDVNTVLLDTIAQENRGIAQYVHPGEDINLAVTSFYEKVSTPVLADIDVDFGTVDVFDTYPHPLPDLFAGSQLIMVGRYEDPGSITLRLSGEVNGETQTFSYSGQTFASRSTEMEFLPRLWATRKIGYLMNQIRLHGSDEELIDEIMDLSLRYGVMTPYTSFLVEEDVDVFTHEGWEEAERSLRYGMPAEFAPASGARAVDNAQAIQGYSMADAAPTPEAESADRLKVVGDKTFLTREDTWIDTAYDEDMSSTKIGFGSDEYFEVLDQRPDWGPYFALGEDVIFVVDGRAYEVTAGDFPAPDVPEGPQPDPAPDVPDAPEPDPAPDVPDAPEPDPNPAVPSPSPLNGDGDTDWQMWTVVGVVVAAVVVATTGLVLRSRRPRAKGSA
jgi:Ca-activated chloride channel family protein